MSDQKDKMMSENTIKQQGDRKYYGHNIFDKCDIQKEINNAFNVVKNTPKIEIFEKIQAHIVSYLKAISELEKKKDLGFASLELLGRMRQLLLFQEFMNGLYNECKNDTDFGG